MLTDNRQGEAVSRKKSRGTGLGLPVSQKIAHEHGGRIVVESTPGQGSRFTLTLPAQFPEPAAAHVETEDWPPADAAEWEASS